VHNEDLPAVFQHFNFVPDARNDTGICWQVGVGIGEIMRRLLIPLRYWRRDKLRHVITYCEGGVYRRIDENRALLETLHDSFPAFISENRWIEGWLEAQDIFLTQLAQAAQIRTKKGSSASTPRPWPGRGRRHRNGGVDTPSHDHRKGSA
jgi:hypothetical protein